MLPKEEIAKLDKVIVKEEVEEKNTEENNNT